VTGLLGVVNESCTSKNRQNSLTVVKKPLLAHAFQGCSRVLSYVFNSTKIEVWKTEE
jgi:hypothetical protein